MVQGDESFVVGGLSDTWWYVQTADSGETDGRWEELWISFRLRVDIDESSIFADGFETGDLSRWADEP